MGAWAESFNAALKNERVYRMVYPTKDKAINNIMSRIESIYIMFTFTQPRNIET